MELCKDGRESFKYRETLYDSLKVCYEASKTLLLFWNKYQLFIHDNQNFKDPVKVYMPEFQVNQVLVGSNNLVCVDSNGNVHTISLRFKNSAQKRMKSSFQPREEGVLQCTQSAPDSALVLKYECDGYFLCWHKMNTEFQLEKKVVLITDTEHWPVRICERGECILSVTKIAKERTSCLKNVFQNQVFEGKDCNLVLISFDKLTVHAGLFYQKNTQDILNMVKLYTSPTEICDIKVFDDLQIIIALSCGTLVKLLLKEKTKPIDIIHLNTAISKFEVIGKDKLVYTNGLTMWKAENILSKDDIIFEQLFVKDVKDFIISGDQVLCTTYTNIIYKFPIDKDSYSNKDVNNYCPVETILNNSEYLYKIMEEVEKNKDIIEKIDCEGNYLTAVTLSKKAEVMKQIIHEEVYVYEKYEHVIKDNSKVILMEEFEKYFEPEVQIFLIKIKTSMIQHTLSNILTEILKNINIHVTLLSYSDKILKTATVKTNESFKHIQLLLSLPDGNITKCKVEVKLVSNIPGAFDNRSESCTILHQNLIELNVEHFIKINNSTEIIINTRENKKNIQESIKEIGENQHGELFQFTDLSDKRDHDTETSYFVKLPENYREVFNDIENFNILHFSTQKVAYLQNILTNEEFVGSKSALFLEIGKEKVKLDIQKDDFCSPLLKISSSDLIIAFDIRNFFAKFLYKEYENCCPGEQFVSNALYTTTENLQKAPKSFQTSEEYVIMLEKFHKNVIGNLPL